MGWCVSLVGPNVFFPLFLLYSIPTYIFTCFFLSRVPFPFFFFSICPFSRSPGCVSCLEPSGPVPRPRARVAVFAVFRSPNPFFGVLHTYLHFHVFFFFLSRVPFTFFFSICPFSRSPVCVFCLEPSGPVPRPRARVAVFAVFRSPNPFFGVLHTYLHFHVFCFESSPLHFFFLHMSIFAVSRLCFLFGAEWTRASSPSSSRRVRRFQIAQSFFWCTPYLPPFSRVLF